MNGSKGWMYGYLAKLNEKQPVYDIVIGIVIAPVIILVNQNSFKLAKAFISTFLMQIDSIKDLYWCN